MRVGEQTESYVHPGTTGYAECRVLAKVLPIAGRMFGEDSCQFLFSGTATETDLKRSHQVLLGGPKYNSEVARLLKHPKVQEWLPVSARECSDEEGGGTAILVKTGTGTEELIAKMAYIDSQQRVTEDLCLFIRMPNPDNPSMTVLMVIGSRTYGVLYGERFFSDRALLRELIRRVGEKSFCTLVRVKVTWEKDRSEPSVAANDGRAFGEPITFSTER